MTQIQNVPAVPTPVWRFGHDSVAAYPDLADAMGALYTVCCRIELIQNPRRPNASIHMISYINQEVLRGAR